MPALAFVLLWPALFAPKTIAWCENDAFHFVEPARDALSHYLGPYSHLFLVRISPSIILLIRTLYLPLNLVRLGIQKDSYSHYFYDFVSTALLHYIGIKWQFRTFFIRFRTIFSHLLNRFFALFYDVSALFFKGVKLCFRTIYITFSHHFLTGFYLTAPNWHWMLEMQCKRLASVRSYLG